jgi:hypothetical protein
VTEKLFSTLRSGGYGLTVNGDIRLEARHLRRERGQLVAELEVLCTLAGAQHFAGSISTADLNFSSQTSRESRAKYLAKRARTTQKIDGETVETVDWAGYVDELAIRILRAEAQGDQAIVLDDAPDLGPENTVVVAGFPLLTDATSMLFAHGGGLKSLFALWLAGQLAQQGRRVLYVDAEWTAARHRARKHKLFGVERLDGLLYRRTMAPLSVELDSLRRLVDHERIDVVMLDSVVPLLDGKAADDDVAQRFMGACRLLPAVLALAHIPKSATGPDAQGTPSIFGSVFFHDLARATWYLKRQTATNNENVVTLGVFSDKNNDGPTTAAHGFEFVFHEAAISVRRVDLASVPEFASKQRVCQRMCDNLRTGPMTTEALADAIDTSPATVRNEVRRHNQLFKRLPDKRLALVEQRAHP